MNVDFHEHQLQRERRDGVEITVLVITTDIPIPPATHIDEEMLPIVVRKIKQSYIDRGERFDEVRLVHRNAKA